MPVAPLVEQQRRRGDQPLDLLVLLARGAAAACVRVSALLRRAGVVLLGLWLAFAVGWSAARHVQWWSTESILEATVDLFPASFNGWKALGEAREAAGDLDGAVAAYRRAGDVAPFAIATVLEASALARLGRHDEARARIAAFLRDHGHRLEQDPRGRELLEAVRSTLRASPR